MEKSGEIQCFEAVCFRIFCVFPIQSVDRLCPTLYNNEKRIKEIEVAFFKSTF